MTRKEICIKAWENNELRQDIFGQFATHNFDDDIITLAIKREWISSEFAEKLLKSQKSYTVLSRDT